MSLLTRYPDHFGESLLGQAQHNVAFADDRYEAGGPEGGEG